jgi:hypothetical protein
MKEIASAFAALTVENAGVSEFQQNAFQKFPRYLLGRGNLLDWYAGNESESRRSSHWDALRPLRKALKDGLALPYFLR